MDNTKTGGAAFPVPYPNSEQGMLLIDYFAAKAMPSIITRSMGLKGIKESNIAAAAYEIAAAMLNERQNYIK